MPDYRKKHFWFGVVVSKSRSCLEVRCVFTVNGQTLITVSERAISYSKRASNLLMASAFEAWRRRRSLHQHHFLLVKQHYAANLLSRMLFIWRLRLRAQLKWARKANMARRYFVERGAWDKWRLVLEKKRRTRKVQDLEREKITKIFLSKNPAPTACGTVR